MAEKGATKETDVEVQQEQVESSVPENCSEDCMEICNNIPSLPEAGGVAFCELYGEKSDAEGVKHLVKINLTARGLTAKYALADLLEALVTAREVYHLNPYNPYERVPQPTPTATPMVQPTTPAVAQPAEPVYENIQPAPQAQNVLQVVKISSTPKPEGKVTIGFFGAGRKYPEVYFNGTTDSACALLQGTGAWQPQHFQVAQEYQANFKVLWRNSDRMNSKGYPYKDIVGIQP